MYLKLRGTSFSFLGTGITTRSFSSIFDFADSISACIHAGPLSARSKFFDVAALRETILRARGEHSCSETRFGWARRVSGPFLPHFNRVQKRQGRSRSFPSRPKLCLRREILPRGSSSCSASTSMPPLLSMRNWSSQPVLCFPGRNFCYPVKRGRAAAFFGELFSSQ